MGVDDDDDDGVFLSTIARCLRMEINVQNKLKLNSILFIIIHLEWTIFSKHTHTRKKWFIILSSSIEYSKFQTEKKQKL